MIEQPAILAAVLVFIVAAVVAISRTRIGEKIFRFLPVPFYCYFLPIVGATLGFFPEKSPVYDFLSRHVLPPCLILLLLGSPWNELARVGREALLAMVIGTVGMIAGAVFGFICVHRNLPAEFWMAAGALLGSWTGGSANMMAVKEALSMPDSFLAPLIVVDTIMAYGWMAILIAVAGYQSKFDAFVRATPIASGQADGAEGDGSALSVGHRIGMVISAVGLGEACVWMGPLLAAFLPQFSAKAWAIILATTVGLALSLTPVRRWERHGASRFGTTILLLMLTSYGAQSNLRAILQSPSVMIFGAVMVATHGIILVACGYVFRIPLFYLATASQACIGGPVSTPIVAGVYQPTLTHVGVVLALIGGAIGTYVGLFGAALCRLFS